MTTTDITPECLEYVDRGARWLDKVYPEWWAQIDLAQLELNNACRCVLGQLAGMAGDERYAYVDDESSTNGFCRVRAVAQAAGFDAYDWAVMNGFEADLTGSYSDLDGAWILEIKRRWEEGVR